MTTSALDLTGWNFYSRGNIWKIRNKAPGPYGYLTEYYLKIALSYNKMESSLFTWQTNLPFGDSRHNLEKTKLETEINNVVILKTWDCLRSKLLPHCLGFPHLKIKIGFHLIYIEKFKLMRQRKVTKLIDLIEHITLIEKGKVGRGVET